MNEEQIDELIKIVRRDMRRMSYHLLAKDWRKWLRNPVTPMPDSTKTWYKRAYNAHRKNLALLCELRKMKDALSR